MFTPEVGLELVIEGKRYRVAAHPAAPWMVYGQEGRAAIVYRLETETGEALALKVFKPRYRKPLLVEQARQLAPFAALPGLRVCKRTVLSPNRHGALLQRYPDLRYAVLMPWIEGPTWMEVVVERRPLEPEVSLEVASRLAAVLAGMEAEGIAHGDLSAPNVLLPALANEEGVELVDVEGLYAPGLMRPEEVLSGSMGYAHQEARQGYWGAEADRFAGAVLLAEMLGWCDERVRKAAWGESYFAPDELQREGERYDLLLAVLEQHWGEEVMEVFQAAWEASRLEDCPALQEWDDRLHGLVEGEPGVTSASSTEGTLDEAAQSLYQLLQIALAKGNWQEVQRLGKAVEAVRPNYRDTRKILERARRAGRETRRVQKEIRRWEHTLKAVQAQLEAEIHQLEAEQEQLEAALRELQARRQALEKEAGALEEAWSCMAEARDSLGKHRWEESLQWLQTIQLPPRFAQSAESLPSPAPSQGEEREDRPSDEPASEPITPADLSAYPVPEPSKDLPLPEKGTTPGAQETLHVAEFIKLVHPRKGWLGETPAVLSLAFSPDGRWLASGAMDRYIRLWKLPEGTLSQTWQTNGAINALSFSLDGEWLAVAAGAFIRLLRMRDGEWLARIEGEGIIYDIALSPDGTQIASAESDHKVRLWRVADGSLLRALQGHNDEVNGVAFSPDGTLIASASDDHTLRLWRASDGTALHVLQGHDHWARSVAFSPDGTLIASASDDETLRLWRTSDGRCIHTLKGHSRPVLSVAFSPDGEVLASGSDDGTVRLWKVEDGSLLHTLTGHSEGVESVVFSPDGCYLASGSGDQTVRLWKVRP